MREGENMAIINSNFRITGLASGLDTDQLVKDLMTVERIPLNKLQQKKQLSEWRQDAYREVTNALRGFKEKFFDITKRTSYLLSDSAFKVYSAKSSSDAHVTVRGTAVAESGNHTVKVHQLATADKAESVGNVSKAITGNVTDFNLSGKSILVELDGVTREINLADYEDLNDLIGDEGNGLQKLLDDAFGAGKILVSEVDDQLQLSTANGATKVSVYYGTKGTEGLNALGFSMGASNRISTGSTLIGLKDMLAGQLNFDAKGEVSFEINGETFTFSQNDTLTKVMETINNNAKAGVRVRYDETTDKFSITAKQTGAGDNIRITEKSGTFFQAIGIDTANPVTEQGVDAIAEIDNITITRNSNTFTVNGLEYTLKQKHAADQIGETITVEQDVDAVYDSIKTFVDEYNKLVDMFSTKLTEKYDRDYQPLTDEEKEALSEKDVEKWEKKAKTGLLKNDSILQRIQSDMRMALISSVEGVGISLSSIGITSKSWQDNGKLTIDEDKLKQAIREKPDEVRNLFIQRSEDVPSYTRDLTAQERSTRSKQQGLLYRISDILEDNISIYRNKDGRKGILLEKAGMEGDASEYNSSIAKDIDDYNDRIKEMLDKLLKKEENYYREFSRLETYMNQMNSQMNWLMSQLNVGQG
jgi:flagellar hook-associated protein 2